MCYLFLLFVVCYLETYLLEGGLHCQIHNTRISYREFQSLCCRKPCLSPAKLYCCSMSAAILPDYAIVQPLTPRTFPKGTFGLIYLANKKGSYQKCALRCVDLSETEDDELQLLRNDILMLGSLCHPNIMCYESNYLKGKDLYISMPYADYGSLRNLLNQDFPFGMNADIISYILQCVLDAVIYLHKNSILHRRIQAKNILIDKFGKVLLTGFEFAVKLAENGHRVKKLHDFPQKTVDFLPWCAPEVLKQDLEGYNGSSDIYSLGVTTCELANGVIPYQTIPTLALLEKISGYHPRLLDQLTMANEPEETIDQVYRQKKFSLAFHEFVNFCLRQEAESRPSAIWLRTHAFVKAGARNNIDHVTCLLPNPPLMNDSSNDASNTVMDSIQEDDVGEALACLSIHEICWDFDNL